MAQAGWHRPPLLLLLLLPSLLQCTFGSSHHPEASGLHAVVAGSQFLHISPAVSWSIVSQEFGPHTSTLQGLQIAPQLFQHSLHEGSSVPSQQLQSHALWHSVQSLLWLLLPQLEYGSSHHPEASGLHAVVAGSQYRHVFAALSWSSTSQEFGPHSSVSQGLQIAPQLFQHSRHEGSSVPSQHSQSHALWQSVHSGLLLQEEPGSSHHPEASGLHTVVAGSQYRHVFAALSWSSTSQEFGPHSSVSQGLQIGSHAAKQL